ncbi:CsbD family protein [Streptomyces sp. NPDC002564]|uniref:CsbD family protein n=1 Tax=Streptomyces sp. NPDC002564 TaxID=3364649 RepID=UPI00368680D0
MSSAHSFRNKAQALKGRITERIGRNTRNKRLQREGRTDRVSGNLKQSGTKAKDAFRREH